jgi:hypothetical protein
VDGGQTALDFRRCRSDTPSAPARDRSLQRLVEIARRHGAFIRPRAKRLERHPLSAAAHPGDDRHIGHGAPHIDQLLEGGRLRTNLDHKRASTAPRPIEGLSHIG